MAKRMIIAARRARGANTVAGRSATRRPVQGKKVAKSSEPRVKRATASRRAAKPTTALRSSKKPTALQFSWITEDLKFFAPVNYKASLLLKSAARNGNTPVYVWWLVVGRHDTDVLTVPFHFDGMSTIRCDVPESIELSEKVISKGLAAFLKSEATAKGLLGAPGGGVGDGGGGPINPH